MFSCLTFTGVELAQIIESISVIIAALAFAVGVDAWRREHIGKRKIELAEDVLTHFYEVRDAVRSIRSPWSNGGEGATRKRSTNETDDESVLLDRAFVVHERFEKRQELFNKLQVLRYRFMAHFGQPAGAPFEELDKILREIFVAAHMLGRHYWKQQRLAQSMNDAEFTKHLKEMQSHEAVFWAGVVDPDPIAPRIDATISNIENICRPIISERVGAFSFLFWRT
jgi:hypothetical protein